MQTGKSSKVNNSQQSIGVNLRRFSRSCSLNPGNSFFYLPRCQILISRSWSSRIQAWRLKRVPIPSYGFLPARFYQSVGGNHPWIQCIVASTLPWPLKTNRSIQDSTTQHEVSQQRSASPLLATHLFHFLLFHRGFLASRQALEFSGR